MHYHCEIVIPPSENIEEVITSVLKPFNERTDENDEDADGRNSFWDWWVIGGRFSGKKLLANYDKEKMAAFYAWLNQENITVSGVTFGKHEISPNCQIQKVDAKWNEIFPSQELMPCPIFKHSNNNSEIILDDIQQLHKVPKSLTCDRVIFCIPSFNYDTEERNGLPEAGFMLCESQWNGCNHMKVEWDGSFHSALQQFLDNTSAYNKKFIEQCTPKDDWLVITVDYHS